mgnify:FL=1
MQAHYRYKKVRLAKSGEVVLPAYRSGSKLVVAVEGEHDEEGVYCIAEIGSKLCGFPERAPDYKANQWEHRVCGTNSNNTFFLEIPEGLEGEKIKIHAVFSNRWKGERTTCNVYLCDKH